MDDKLNELNSIINEKKEKYKDICLLWKNYIKIKKIHFENELNIAIEQLKNIDEIIDEDIPLETLIILTSLREFGL
tara:strand:+ start:3618 stop:3845 length:228 start_codon:yes stop_codon:yes gene_type:complete